MKQYTLMNKKTQVFDFWYDEEEHLIIKFDYNFTGVPPGTAALTSLTLRSFVITTLYVSLRFNI